MEILWSADKNQDLLERRGLCFEMVLEKILMGDFVGPEINPSRENQFRIIVVLDNYPYVVPMIIDENGGWKTVNRNPEQAPLDQEEQWYEDHADEFVPGTEQLRNSLIEAARTSSQKTERMNIRMTRHDMENLKLAAAREGIPYQSLVSSILHKYTMGALVDINEARKLLSR